MGERGINVALVQMAVVFAYIIYQFLASPAVWGGNPFAYGYVAASFIVGAVLYFASKSYNNSRGIDVTLAYKQIPPE